MSSQELDTLFENAFIKASGMAQASIPPDTMLRLYAYYKQATIGSFANLKPSIALGGVEAFKINAWLQVSNLTPNQAKKEYIALVDLILSK